LVVAAIAAATSFGLLAALLWTDLGSGGPDEADRSGGPAEGSVLEVPPPGEVRAGLLRDGLPVFVVRHEDGTVTVVEAFSPHVPWGIGKLIGWCASTRTFDDPFHGSLFDEFGGYLFGPASRDLVVRSADFLSGDRTRVTVGGPLEAESRMGTAGESRYAPLCEGLAAPGAAGAPDELVVPAVDSLPTYDSPGEAVAASPEGWIVLRGSLLVTEQEEDPVLLCAPSEDDDVCLFPAEVAGVDRDILQGEPFVTIDGLWLARIQDGVLRDLTRIPV
jgi:Rieske Fe-S protein